MLHHHIEPSRREGHSDLSAVPSHCVGELIDGVLYTSPRPAPAHAFTAGSIGADLTLRFQRGQGGPGGWWILPEPELHIGGDVLVPDLAGWRRDALPEFPLEAAAIEVAPDWVCEISTPSTARYDRAVKVPRYHRMEVGYVWLVAPLDRVIDVFRWSPGGWYLDGGLTSEDGEAALEPFGEVPLDIAVWWAGNAGAAASGAE